MVWFGKGYHLMASVKVWLFRLSLFTGNGLDSDGGGDDDKD